jgi:hypothetical protein
MQLNTSQPYLSRFRDSHFERLNHEGHEEHEGNEEKFFCLSFVLFVLDSPDNNASGGQEPFCKRVPGPPQTFYQVLFLALSLSASSRALRGKMRITGPG